MSTATEQLRARWSRKRLQRAAEKARATAGPYLDRMESENGMLAMLMVSGIAQLAVRGLESQAALAATIKRESIKSGIPEDVLAAHARFSSEMVTCFEFDQQPNEAHGPKGYDR